MEYRGHGMERRLERQLVRDYERIIDELLDRLDPERITIASELASLPAKMRGYGHIKRKNIEAAREREAELLAQFRSPARKPEPLAA